MGERLHFYHRCYEWPCRAKADRKPELIHCPKWRVLDPDSAAHLPYDGDQVQVLIASRLQEESEADGGNWSRDEADALGQLDGRNKGKADGPDQKKARAGAMGTGSKESVDHFQQHLGRSISTAFVQLA